MGHSICLSDHSARLFYGVLETHDFLWFASYDVSGLSATEVVIHNYALTYALSRFERGLVFEPWPTYQADLAQMPLYTTPADLLVQNNPFAGKIKLTWNALDTRTQKTETPGFRDKNSPKFGRRMVVAPMTRFGFYVFVFDGSQPPGAIRLGKKRSPCRVRYMEIPDPVALLSKETFTPSHLVNPLDVTGKVVTFGMVNIPPHLLLRNAHLREDYIVKYKDGRTHHIIHVPKRVLKRIEEQ